MSARWYFQMHVTPVRLGFDVTQTRLLIRYDSDPDGFNAVVSGVFSRSAGLCIEA